MHYFGIFEARFEHIFHYWIEVAPVTSPTPIIDLIPRFCESILKIFDFTILWIFNHFEKKKLNWATRFSTILSLKHYNFDWDQFIYYCSFI